MALHPKSPPATGDRRGTPLDTSAVDKVMRMFRTCQDQTAEALAPLTKIKIAPRGYHELLETLERDPALRKYVDDKVRFDFEPGRSILTLRMPSPVHDFFRTLLANEIRDQLRQVASEGGATGEFAAKIEDGSSSRILLKEGVEDGDPGYTVRREPDGQFQHEDAIYPGVVLEVSYSQDGKDLRKLAHDYILRSNGDIKAVIGIDIKYDGIESTASLWRPNYIKEAGEELEILESYTW